MKRHISLWNIGKYKYIYLVCSKHGTVAFETMQEAANWLRKNPVD